MRQVRWRARGLQGRGAFRSRRGARALPQSPLRRLDGMVREVQQAGQGAGPRRPAPLRGVEQPARAERHGPLCLRHDGRDDLGADETTWSCDGLRGYIYGFFTDDIALFRFRGTRRKFVPKFVDLLRKASEHSGIRAFEHSSIYSLRCSQAQMPKCCSRRFAVLSDRLRDLI